MSKAPVAPYTVIKSDGPIEIRKYPEIITAHVRVSGSEDEALNKGFGKLADFIFGNNRSKKSIAMTAPVMQQASEKIAMTAPVLQQKNNNDWIITFVMPQEYSLATLPAPVNQEVIIQKEPATTYIVIRFSGFSGSKHFQKQLEKLQKYLDLHSYKTTDLPIFARYNPPWTLPFFRRNEVMLKINQ
jgi:hypothetical protein